MGGRGAHRFGLLIEQGAHGFDLPRRMIGGAGQGFRLTFEQGGAAIDDSGGLTRRRHHLGGAALEAGAELFQPVFRGIARFDQVGAAPGEDLGRFLQRAGRLVGAAPHGAGLTLQPVGGRGEARRRLVRRIHDARHARAERVGRGLELLADALGRRRKVLRVAVHRLGDLGRLRAERGIALLQGVGLGAAALAQAGDARHRLFGFGQHGAQFGIDTLAHRLHAVLGGAGGDIDAARLGARRHVHLAEHGLERRLDVLGHGRDLLLGGGGRGRDGAGVLLGRHVDLVEHGLQVGFDAATGGLDVVLGRSRYGRQPAGLVAHAGLDVAQHGAQFDIDTVAGRLDMVLG